MKLSDKKRHQIILASVQEFKENGFNGTSMDSVAKRAEVSKRTVYNHFDSKDALFFGIVEHMFSLIAATRPAPYDDGTPIEKQLTEIAAVKIRLFSSDEFMDLSRVALPEAILHPEEMQMAMTQFAEIETSMELWFEKAIADNKLKMTNPNDACDQFMGLIKMDAYWPRLLKGKIFSEDEIMKTAQKTAGMFLSYFGNA